MLRLVLVVVVCYRRREFGTWHCADTYIICAILYSHDSWNATLHMILALEPDPSLLNLVAQAYMGLVQNTRVTYSSSAHYPAVRSIVKISLIAAPIPQRCLKNTCLVGTQSLKL